MRRAVLTLVAVFGLMAFPSPVRAAPIVPGDPAVTAAAPPAITMVRQRCGEGMKREKAWQDKSGAWHGPCVPKGR